MSKTRAQIQFNTFAILTGGDVGVGVSAEDATAIDEAYDSIIASLGAKKIVSIPDANDLADELFEPVCQLTANLVSNQFAGKSDPAITRYYENEIRVINAQTPGYSPQVVEYF